jgi:6-pyruvoyltetrahydropterin/6-carboxytetrahydropterin synthase
MAAVRLTRRVAFSSGHRYWLPGRTELENRALFGRWASPHNHGHNYVLEATVEGEPDPADGMVVNIKRIDDALREAVVAPMDQKSLNDETPWFAGRAPTIENLLLTIRDQLAGLPARLVALRLEETPLLYGEWRVEDPPMTLTRVYEFAASHRLHCEGLSAEENLRLFGKCNNPHGHGHNYVLEVTVSGEPDPVTGMLVDVEALDRAVNAQVIERYDHKNLGLDVPELAGRNATSEVVALAIFERLDGALPARLHRVRLHETARSVFEVAAPDVVPASRRTAP